MNPPWQPLDTLPDDRAVLVARYAPTSWTYHVAEIDPRMWKQNPRFREIEMRHTRAWMEKPPAPEDEAGTFHTDKKDPE